jgi:alcohol dehydrogenase class IV
MKTNTYFNPVKTLFGIGSFEKIGEICNDIIENKNLKESEETNKLVLVVTDTNLLNILKISEKLPKLLKKYDIQFDLFEKDDPYSSFDIIEKGVKFANLKKYLIIIGIGGGAAMDTAKCIAILKNNPGKISNYASGILEIKNAGIPLIEIPTTSGTGSEVTKWATTWDTGDVKKKYSLSSDKMFAQVSIIDPELTLSLPPRLTAITGLDALAQAIEAYWSRNHNLISDMFALRAIETIIKVLVLSCKNPQNLEYRKELCLGSLLSGLAFSNTKTTAVHSVSYPITIHYGVPHGLACALTLGSFLEYNSIKCPENIDEGPERILTISTLLGQENAVKGKQFLSDIMVEMGLPVSLSQLGIDKSGIELILREGFTPDRVKHNARELNEDNLRKILIDLK